MRPRRRRRNSPAGPPWSDPLTQSDFPVRETEFTAGGQRLFAITIGDLAGHDRALVFLHGGVGCARMWRDFPETLCRKAGLPGLVYDRLGFGGSAPLDELEGPRFRNREGEETLPLVLDALGIRGAVLVGHSEGGAIALLGAAAHPDGIRAVVGLAPQLSVHDRAVADTREIVELYETGGLRERLVKYHGEKFDRTFARWAEGWTGPEAAGWSIERELAAIACPVLAIIGEDDEHGYLPNVEVMKRHIRATLHIHLLEGARHHPQDEARDRVLELIGDFLGGI